MERLCGEHPDLRGAKGRFVMPYKTHALPCVGLLERFFFLKEHQNRRFAVVTSFDAGVVDESGLPPCRGGSFVCKERVNSYALSSARRHEMFSEVSRDAGSEAGASRAGDQEHIDTDLSWNVEVRVLDKSNRFVWRLWWRFDDEALD